MGKGEICVGNKSGACERLGAKGMAATPTIIRDPPPTPARPCSYSLQSCYIIINRATMSLNCLCLSILPYCESGACI